MHLGSRYPVKRNYGAFVGPLAPLPSRLLVFALAAREVYNVSCKRDKGNKIRYRCVQDKKQETGQTVNCDQATRFRCSVYGFRFIYLAVTESLVPPPPGLSLCEPILLSSFVVRNDKGILFDERVYPPPSLLTKFIIMFCTAV